MNKKYFSKPGIIKSQKLYDFDFEGIKMSLEIEKLLEFSQKH
jgi:hypothetical protein